MVNILSERHDQLEKSKKYTVPIYEIFRSLKV